MKLAIITCAFFPRAEGYIDPLRESARKYGYPPVIPFGIGQPYLGWAEMKLRRVQQTFIDALARGYTHVLYSDGRDAFFTAPPGAIMSAYHALGSPPAVASAERTANPFIVHAPNYPPASEVGPYRFHCVGGYLGEIPYLLDRFEALDARYGSLSGDDAEIWQLGWRDHVFRPLIDHRCLIFQTTSDGGDLDLRMAQGRLFNAATGSYPAVLHVNGGFSEDAPGAYRESVRNWWRKIHPELEL